MDSFKKVVTIDGQPIFRGKHNNIHGYYTFEHYKGMGDSWYTCPVFLGRTKEEVKDAPERLCTTEAPTASGEGFRDLIMLSSRS